MHPAHNHVGHYPPSGQKNTEERHRTDTQKPFEIDSSLHLLSTSEARERPYGPHVTLAHSGRSNFRDRRKVTNLKQVGRCRYSDGQR